MTFVPVQPPHETSCEKNWLPLGGNRVIYGWHPFTIGEVNKEHSPAELEIVQTFDTPSWFRHLRGSALLFGWTTSFGYSRISFRHMLQEDIYICGSFWTRTTDL